MQALCQWDVQREQSPEALNEFLASQDVPDTVAAYARQVVEAFWSQRQRVDDRIAAAAANWDLSRISPVERNVMRVAVVELLTAEVPPRAALDEAVGIGGAFGGADSPRFINGVLDKVFRRLSRRRKGNG